MLSTLIELVKKHGKKGDDGRMSVTITPSQIGGMAGVDKASVTRVRVCRRQERPGTSRRRDKKGAGAICAQHPSGRSGKWHLPPFCPTPCLNPV